MVLDRNVVGGFLIQPVMRDEVKRKKSDEAKEARGKAASNGRHACVV